MINRNKISATVLFFGLFALANGASNPVVTVVGKIRDVMMGNDSAKIRVQDLDLHHLYAVGPITGLDGEITIIDGDVILARVLADGSVQVEHSSSCSAPFLVYSKIDRWRKIAVPRTVATNVDFESFVERAAKEAGLDAEAPFPFLLEGRFSKMTFHVVRKTKPNANAHDSRVTFSETDLQGEVVGFFSKHDQGVFTHKDSFVYMHLYAGTHKLSGHVEGFEFDPSSDRILFLPE